MRWKAHFFLKGGNNIDTIDNFNLKKKKRPPICEDMQAFENYLTDMVKKHQIHETPGQFPEKIINDTKRIYDSKKIFIFADKTTNIYSTRLTNYKNLTTNNVTHTSKRHLKS